MGEAFEVPDSIVGWINGRLKAADQEIHLNSLHIDDAGACRVTGTVKKLGISADVELRFRLSGRDQTLIVQDVEIETSNPIGKTFMPQIKGFLLAKGREALAPLGIEIVDSP